MPENQMVDDQSCDETPFEFHYESCYIDIMSDSQTRLHKSTTTRFLIKSASELFASLLRLLTSPLKQLTSLLN